MEHEGNYVTGMNNQIVWGLPHIFAVTLIVIASGVVNIASLSSAFNKKLYKPEFFVEVVDCKITDCSAIRIFFDNIRRIIIRGVIFSLYISLL